MRRGGVTAVLAALVAAFVAVAAACGTDGGAEGDGPTIAVTTPILGSLVRDLVGDQADVVVAMPNGADPHEYSPSAKTVAAINNADLIVENGLDLEEGLHDVLDNARADGVPVFTATDHVTLRETTGGHDHDEDADHGDHGDDGDAGEAGHDHGGNDPHIWMDPIAMRDMVRALAPVLDRDLGLQVADRGTDLAGRLDTLDGRVRELLAGIPPAERKLVTGHESMGYFADRYDLEVVGALLPSLSSQAQVSASNLAALRAQVQREGVPVIFNEVGTPEGVADAVAKESGARVVDLPTHTLPDDGSYFTFITDAATTIAEAYHAG